MLRQLSTPVPRASVLRMGDARMKGLFLAASLAAVSVPVSACVAQQPSPRSAPTVCEVKQAAWCLLLSDARIESVPLESDDFHSAWFVRGERWAALPAVILEPSGCREGYADTVELRRFEAEFDWEGQTWNRVEVRLKSNGACDLSLLSPTVARDPVGSAFMATMTLVRACYTSDCSGPVVALKIRPLIARQ